MRIRPNSSRLAAAAVSLAALLTACGDGRVSGPGEFAVLVSYCQEQIQADLQYPAEIEFPESQVWHSGDKSALLVGGMFSVPNMRQVPEFYAYQCLIQDGRMIYARFE